MSADRYIPALGYRSLTRFYDPVVALTTREATFKAALVQQAGIAPGHRVLDLACGTGTLALMLKRDQPGAEVTGIDGDQDVLQIARAKATASGVSIEFDQGLSYQLPYEAGRFDRVVSSLFFHHLGMAAKSATLTEIYRVLKPGGEVHIADWGKAQNLPMRLAFLGIQLLDGFETTTPNVSGRIPDLMREAGFVSVAETRCFATLFGTMSLYRALRDPSARI